MNREGKFGKTITQISNICIVALPILVVLYFWWLQNTRLFIFIKNYKIILFGCGLVLWIGFLFTIAVFVARKHFVLGAIFLLITIPCLSISSLGLIGYSPSAEFFSNLPILYDHAQLDNNSYYLTSEGGPHGINYLELYKCQDRNFRCETVFSDADRFGGQLRADIANNEINIVDGEGKFLIYTYGEKPYCSDTHQKTQLKNHLYYLSRDCEMGGYNECGYPCDENTYTLHECNLDYTACNSLPIQYKANNAGLSLEADEATNEISVYNDYGWDDQTLIFTYGPHPHCYVEGCTITNEQK